MCYINALDNTFAFQVIVKLESGIQVPLTRSQWLSWILLNGAIHSSLVK